MTKLTTPARIKTYVPKAPSQRAYAPKPADAGQRVTWTRTTGYASAEERNGTIWSAGPLPMSVWVQPDDAKSGDMALVMLRSMTEHSAYPASWQHDTLKRCENLRRSGLFEETETIDRGYSYGPRETYERTQCYHTDPECCEVKPGNGIKPSRYLTTGDLIRALLSQGDNASTSGYCLRCVYLSQPAEVSEAA